MKKMIYFLLIVGLVSCSTTGRKPSNTEESEQKAELKVFNKALLDEGRPHNVNLSAPYFETSSKEVKESTDQAIKDLTKNLDKISNIKKSNQNFKNTIVALEDAYSDYFEVAYRLGFIKYTSLSESVRNEANTAGVRLEKYSIEQSYRDDVYQKIHAFELSKPKLSGVDKRLYEDVLRNYKRQGMSFSKKRRSEIEKLKKEISELEVKISTNIAADKTIVVLKDEEALEIPKDNLESLKKNIDGKYQVQVGVAYEASAVIKYSPREYLRKKVYKARTSRQQKENAPIMKKVVHLKSLLAKKLGYKNWADYKLEVKMAKDFRTANRFEKKLIKGLEGKFQGEIEELAKLKRRETKNSKAKINSWDVSYYTRILKKEKYQLDLDQLKKYFSMDSVLDGMFSVFEELFELKITYEQAPYVWDEAVRLIKITDSVTKKPLGLLYLDLFPRPEHKKYGHFAMFGMRDNKELPDGTARRPVGALVCNFPLPTKNKPSLLTFGHVETMFHEFGHALHHILTESKYSTFSGTNVPRDFVEAPSQMLENWVLDKNVLDRFAKNYKDPEDKVPSDILEKIKKAGQATKGVFYRRQLSFGLLDLELHSMRPHQAKSLNIIKQTNKTLKKVYLEFPKGSSFITGFGHVFGGYDAGYYGYAWADSIAADMASIFENSEGGFLNHEVGMRLRREIYEKGSTRDITKSVESFLQRKSSSKAFYKKIGL